MVLSVLILQSGVVVESLTIGVELPVLVAIVAVVAIAVVAIVVVVRVSEIIAIVVIVVVVAVVAVGNVGTRLTSCTDNFVLLRIFINWGHTDCSVS